MATTSKNMLMLKACLPLLPVNNRHSIIMYIKFQELITAMNLKRNCPLFAANNSLSVNPVSLLDLINDYLDENEKNTISSFKEMFEMIELLKAMEDE
ncbi:MAG: hypothetical protein E7265_05595 [Lachnospiraceae bacterium]|nr:hypothetical protein [Lachnospiraceae bacterium]